MSRLRPGHRVGYGVPFGRLCRPEPGLTARPSRPFRKVYPFALQLQSPDFQCVATYLTIISDNHLTR